MNPLYWVLGLLVISAGVLRGEMRTSADYRIVTDVTDSVGGRSSSALYRNDGSAGGVFGRASVPAAEVRDTGGFIGQLEEAVADRVFNLNDGGPGSLREVIASAASGAIVTFAPYLNGGIIRLSTGALVIGRDLVIDASGLADGIVIDANGAVTQHRVIEIVGGSAVTMERVTLIGGETDGLGGGIANGSGSDLYLRHCTLSGHRAARGGAIYNFPGATVRVEQSTLSGNSSTGIGGAIANEGDLILHVCTLSGNRAGSFGGGVLNYGSGKDCVLTHCTIAGNFAVLGGGFFSQGIPAPAAVTIENCIIAGNEAADQGADLFESNNTTYVIRGSNLIGDNETVGELFPPSPLVGSSANPLDPMLAALGDYGGPTPTMALKVGSLAREAAVGSDRTSDQRGFPIVGVADLGAYEAGNLAVADYEAWAAEVLPAGATVEQRDGGGDFDLDGVSNEDEWIALTDPTRPGSVFAPVSRVGGGEVVLSFVSAVGRSYRLEQNDDLDGDVWVDVEGTGMIEGDGGVLEFTVPSRSVRRRFYRVVVGF